METRAVVALITDEEDFSTLRADMHLDLNDFGEARCRLCNKSGWYLVGMSVEIMREYPEDELVYICTDCITEQEGAVLSARFTTNALHEMYRAINGADEDRQPGMYQAVAEFFRDNDVELDEDIPEDHPLLAKVMPKVHEVMSSTIHVIPEGSKSRGVAESFLHALGQDISDGLYRQAAERYIALTSAAQLAAKKFE